MSNPGLCRGCRGISTLVGSVSVPPVRFLQYRPGQGQHRVAEPLANLVCAGHLSCPGSGASWAAAALALRLRSTGRRKTRRSASRPLRPQGPCCPHAFPHRLVCPGRLPPTSQLLPLDSGRGVGAVHVLPLAHDKSERRFLNVTPTLHFRNKPSKWYILLLIFYLELLHLGL